MANPHPTEPHNRKVEELADKIHDATNDLNDWLYDRNGPAIASYVNTVERIVGWAEELRAEVGRWSKHGRTGS
jgi:hypothetical protein